VSVAEGVRVLLRVGERHGEDVGSTVPVREGVDDNVGSAVPVREDVGGDVSEDVGSAVPVREYVEAALLLAVRLRVGEADLDRLDDLLTDTLAVPEEVAAADRELVPVALDEPVPVWLCEPVGLDEPVPVWLPVSVALDEPVPVRLPVRD
jgi:hypothetical protein